MPPTISFLDLPLQARLKIYSYSGWLRPCPIELVTLEPYHGAPSSRQAVHTECLYIQRKTGCHISIDRERPDCVCAKLPTQLLFVSRAIHAETFSIFYGQNKFVLRAQVADDLTPLRELSIHALSAMTSLLIRLKCWPCPRGHEESRPDGLFCLTCGTPTLLGTAALSSTDQTGRDLVREWGTLCRYLSSAISPGQLRFTFICDVEDLDTGRQVIEPLLGLPTLKQCNIRLGRQRNYQLSALAQETSLRMMGLLGPKLDPFPFGRLPRELRLYILGFTHLGRRGYRADGDNHLRIQGSKLACQTDGPLRKSCCRQCTETLIDCCCPNRRASYSRDCDCRLFPFELALVNRQFHQDAMEVLFSQNCFDFFQDPEETISFLSRLPKGALSYIRRVQFQISEDEVVHWDEWDYSRKWDRLITFVKDNLELSRLSIVIILETWDLGLFRESEQNRFIYDVYCQVTRTSRMIRGVYDIRFELGWFIGLEPLMAKAVMGEKYINRHPETHIPLRDRDQSFFKVPTWYNPSDLTG
ncbi:hypothetical protein M430DRAFT_180225 [Amorphotheca resinae ATCC 22711]|uniref:Uncharacterized protein n=1 Tax=Amorphotheca resinae ATCC 22711 TaxID=857342 RepID=A0A2T3ATR6_AMORE|nr:hypothetical protein M430DRAFT_180225 [Amorphotheca resinae ATCC 22711]PSS10877.1 hypothetical protein M430DRAFT_180225 [Amorphotheca resinae ATCC 22711]